MDTEREQIRVYNYRERVLERESERLGFLYIFVVFLSLEGSNVSIFFQLERESKSGAKLKAYEGVFLFFVLCVWIYEKGYGGQRQCQRCLWSR